MENKSILLCNCSTPPLSLTEQMRHRQGGCQRQGGEVALSYQIMPWVGCNAPVPTPWAGTPGGAATRRGSECGHCTLYEPGGGTRGSQRSPRYPKEGLRGPGAVGRPLWSIPSYRGNMWL